jgi:hypothetical protein
MPDVAAPGTHLSMFQMSWISFQPLSVFTQATAYLSAPSCGVAPLV